MVQKVTLMEMYLIEILRSHGVSDEEILTKVSLRNVEDWQHYHESFDFAELIPLDETGVLAEVLANGYEVKYLTFTGLVNVLDIKFGKTKELDYVVTDFMITGLTLTERERNLLEQMLSANWQLNVLPEGITIYPTYAK